MREVRGSGWTDWSDEGLGYFFEGGGLWETLYEATNVLADDTLRKSLVEKVLLLVGGGKDYKERIYAAPQAQRRSMYDRMERQALELMQVELGAHKGEPLGQWAVNSAMHAAYQRAAQTVGLDYYTTWHERVNDASMGLGEPLVLAERLGIDLTYDDGWRERVEGAFFEHFREVMMREKSDVRVGRSGAGRSERAEVMMSAGGLRSLFGATAVKGDAGTPGFVPSSDFVDYSSPVKERLIQTLYNEVVWGHETFRPDDLGPEMADQGLTADMVASIVRTEVEKAISEVPYPASDAAAEAKYGRWWSGGRAWDSTDTRISWEVEVEQKAMKGIALAMSKEASRYGAPLGHWAAFMNAVAARDGGVVSSHAFELTRAILQYEPWVDLETALETYGRWLADDRADAAEALSDGG